MRMIPRMAVPPCAMRRLRAGRSQGWQGAILIADMMIRISGAAPTARPLQRAMPDRMGVLVTLRVPARWRCHEPGACTIAADNDAHCAWSAARFRRLLECHASQARRFARVAAPDVGGNAHATLERWDAWSPVIHACGYRCAFVLHDGVEDTGAPADADALFVGGSDPCCASDTLRAIIQDAVARTLWVHVGRITPLHRYRRSDALGWTSCDRTRFSRCPGNHAHGSCRAPSCGNASSPTAPGVC